MKKYGLLGKNIAYSLSPFIHSEIAAYIGEDITYEIIDISKVSEIDIIEMIRKEFDGVNITIPYKKTLINLLDEVSEEALKIGAINTIANVNGKLIGYNTDYFGFALTVEAMNINISACEVVIMGSGGAAFSVLTYLLDERAQDITILSRNADEAKKTIFDNNYFKKCRNIIEVVDYENFDSSFTSRENLLVNTTPQGMTGYGFTELLKKEELSKFDNFIDLIYSPLNTPFIDMYKKVKGQSSKYCNGIKMLVYQAIRAEEIWQKKDICYDIAKDIIYKLYH